MRRREFITLIGGSNMAAHGTRSGRATPVVGLARRTLDFWRDNDTVEVIGLPIEFERGTNVKSKVGG
jgi:hypothetical protein